MTDKLVFMTARLRGEDGSRTLTIRIKDKLLQEIESIAEKTGYSRNRLFSILLEFAVNNCEIKDKN